MPREPWYESDNPDRVGRAIFGRGVLIAIAVALLVALLGLAGWGVKVALSDVKGRGDQIVQKNSGTNRIAAQERFEQLYAEIKAADQKLDVYAAAVKADPTYVTRQNFTGAQTYCLSVVADYNAEARKYTARDFRAIDLPEQIDTFNPTTDCKESFR